MPAPRQSLRRRAGVRTKGNTLGLTSCRPPCGEGCVRPPVPKAKLWLEQAGSEHRASARGMGGDSGVWKGASKGGNAPITGPFPPPGGRKGNVMERRGENGKMQVGPTTNSTTRLPVRPASSCSNKSFAFGTLGLVGTGSHGGARPSPTSCRHPSRCTARPKVWGFSGRARTPAIPPTAGRGTHKG